VQTFTPSVREARKALVDRAFGRALATARDERGLSQDGLALAMGWKNRSTVAKIEAGRRPVSLSEAHLLAQILEMRLADLLKLAETLIVTLRRSRK
jgi:transcriptional regulator with XRE-family HTH domain